MNGASTRFLARYWNRIQESGAPDACWIFTSSRTDGYANLRVRQMMHAHRFAWELHNGPVPEGLYVCHTCDCRTCVNPAHLWLGTNEDNMRDMVVKGRAWNPTAALMKSRTHCPQGHEYSPENTILYGPAGHRTCRTCRTVRDRARWQAEKQRREAEACALRIAFAASDPAVSDLAAFDKEADEAILALETAKEVAEDRIAAMEAR